MRLHRKKLGALTKLVKKGLEVIMPKLGGTAASELQNAVSEVKLASEKVKDIMKDSTEKLKDFVANCGTLMTGRGPEQEYLLDLCSQDSTACIDHAEASHVGCCCGYMPLLGLGTEMGTNTIPGLGAEKFTGHIKSRTGRRAKSQIKGANEICAEAQVLASTSVSKLEKETDSLSPGLWTKMVELKRAKYTDYFGRCDETSIIRKASKAGIALPHMQMLFALLAVLV